MSKEWMSMQESTDRTQRRSPLYCKFHSPNGSIFSSRLHHSAASTPTKRLIPSDVSCVRAELVVLTSLKPICYLVHPTANFIAGFPSSRVTRDEPS
jgi:hypothetical protein